MHSRFHSSFDALAENLRTALAPLLSDDRFPGMFTAAQAAEIKQRSGLDDDALAFALLPLAASCARTGISHFNVGAVARGVSGNLYFGANMEFPGTTMQQTVHAEQSAISHAWMRGETALVALTVNYTPCGHCRQFMNELNSGSTLRINLPGRPSATLGDYLPDAFGPRDLEITHLLMDEQSHDLHADGDALCQAAVAAANRSHTPYSHSPAGVAIAMQDGSVFTGSYAENAAFNPTLRPLQCALNVLSLSGYHYADITRAVLAEKAGATLTQWDATRATLQAIGCDKVERLVIA